MGLWLGFWLVGGLGALFVGVTVYCILGLIGWLWGVDGRAYGWHDKSMNVQTVCELREILHCRHGGLSRFLLRENATLLRR